MVGGPRRSRGRRGSRCVQTWADSHQTSIVGDSHDRSSRLPALIQTISGASARTLNTGEPHRGQNFRARFSPLSVPVVWNVASGSPSRWNVDARTGTTTENAVPDERWQSLQLQTTVDSGSGLPVTL